MAACHWLKILRSIRSLANASCMSLAAVDREKRWFWRRQRGSTWHYNITSLNLIGVQKNKQTRPQLHRSRSAEMDLHYIVITTDVKVSAYKFARKLYWSLIGAQKANSLLEMLLVWPRVWFLTDVVPQQKTMHWRLSQRVVRCHRSSWYGTSIAKQSRTPCSCTVKSSPDISSYKTLTCATSFTWCIRISILSLLWLGPLTH